MTTRQPPPLATWVLRRFYAGYQTEALLGDLSERYNARRSSFWYWRQVVATVAISITVDVRTHKLLAARAVLLGMVAVYGFRFLLGFVAMSPVGNLVEALSGESRHVFFGMWAAPMTMVVAGWIVGRFHRGHATAMLLTFAIAVLISNVPELERRMANAMLDVRYVPALDDFVFAQAVAMCNILLGGSLSAVRLGEAA